MSSDLSNLFKAVSLALSGEDNEQARYFVPIDSVTRPVSPILLTRYSTPEPVMSTVTRPASPILVTRPVSPTEMVIPYTLSTVTRPSTPEPN